LSAIHITTVISPSLWHIGWYLPKFICIKAAAPDLRDCWQADRATDGGGAIAIVGGAPVLLLANRNDIPGEDLTYHIGSYRKHTTNVEKCRVFDQPTG